MHCRETDVVKSNSLKRIIEGDITELFIFVKRKL